MYLILSLRLSLTLGLNLRRTCAYHVERRRLIVGGASASGEPHCPKKESDLDQKGEKQIGQ
jgi:hypothetical protein